MPATKKPAQDEAIAALVNGTHRDPFAVLGPHADAEGAIIVRAFQPAARSVEIRLVATGALVPMTRRSPEGVFEGQVGRVAQVGQVGQVGEIPDYRLRITFAGGQVTEIDDPYRYGRVLTDEDLHLFTEG